MINKHAISCSLNLFYKVYSISWSSKFLTKRIAVYVILHLESIINLRLFTRIPSGKLCDYAIFQFNRCTKCFR